MREEATRALDLLAPHRSLLLAVSGGPDSIALMQLCANWAERGKHEVAVATVDHGLRPDSRLEAEQVGAWARALRFSHHLLTWSGEKPATRIQERAREARYALLAGCAQSIGATAIVTAHHADDQAETILFRLTRGSGVAGLAGMSANARCGGVALLRPLLALRKAQLIACCQAAGRPYFTDPANANEAYARARLRRLMPELARLGLDADALLRLGERAARADLALTACTENLRAAALTERRSDFACFDAAALIDAPLELLQRLLSEEIARLSPRAQLRLDRLERAAAGLSGALKARGALRLTLAGLMIDASPTAVTLQPAPPRRNEPLLARYIS